ncbi:MULTISPECIES: ParB/RepB/Spo0J family partition protein [unclassified Corallococcus]|uniref:ParB/RepB/Spo0J family partition protein n=1 Tax=unclassified Corallococcus TaxID=2685029 RepID=UPI001A90B9B0|nr:MULTISPECIES: ParB N-terminal domain-containing protein [unclassified Corallococcus]MBN9684512.1 ParB N-terminal domain-containing protein [Corallococcus sp. NCSPR001]WAS84014.1 ParB N-terminal domain-containing protein [Corallococcus sp. NCRR]
MDAEHRAEGQEGMPGTPGENATPSQQEGVSDASAPKHGEGASGDVTPEGAPQAEAGGAQTDLPGEGGQAAASATEASAGGQGSDTGAASGSDASSADGEGHGFSHSPAVSAAGGEGSRSDASEARDAEAGTDSSAAGGQGGADAAGQGEGTGSGAEASQGPGRYVELSSGESVQDASGTGSDGGGEAKDVLEEPRSGPVSGADDALLSSGIWDVASRASQEDAGSTGSGDGSEQGANDGAATSEGEPHAQAIEPRVMGQVTAMVLPLERLEEDTTFRLRDEGDVSELATDLARLGQLFPVDVRPRGEDRYQLICGFRRVAALRFLKRDQVQVRVHEELSDEDALLLSLAEAIHASPVEHDVLEAKRESLETEGRLTAPVRDMLEKALATEETLAPEGVEEEIDADELAVDVAQRMGALNQDLSLLADVFAALDESRKAELLMQLRYSAQLVAYLEGL